MAQQLSEVLNTVVEQSVPTRCVCKHSKPWIRKELSEQLKRQRTARSRWKKRRSPRNYAAYQEMVQTTESMFLDARRNWWEEEIRKLEEAPQGQKWRILDRITNPSARIGIQPVQVNGTFVFNDTEIMNEMEKVHVRKNVQSGKDPGWIDMKVKNWISETKDSSSDICITDDLMNEIITEEEVHRTYEQCSNTAGPDGVTACMIDKAHRPTMTKCLYRLWNRIWADHEIPSQWKLEHRKLIPKIGKECYNHCNAYRTVSITDILGKRLEKVISARLTCQLESKGFDEHQFAYLSGRSSTQAVLSLVEVIKCNMINHHITRVLFFDFADAFGSVDRTMLLYKLQCNFGISGRLFLYLVSFLSGRQAHISVNRLIGDWIASEDGTSAGTILRAILFIAYVHCARYSYMHTTQVRRRPCWVDSRQ